MKKPLNEAERLSHFWREVVYQNLRDLLLEGEANQQDRIVAHRFVFDTHAGIGSFDWACRMGGLDPEKIRDELKARGM